MDPEMGTHANHHAETGYRTLDLPTFQHVGRRASNHDKRLLNISLDRAINYLAHVNLALFLRHALCISVSCSLSVERSHDVGYSRGRIDLGVHGFGLEPKHIIVDPLITSDLHSEKVISRFS